ncbi:MAG: SH3 domain-containing protein [Caldilineaceae bacterium]
MNRQKKQVILLVLTLVLFIAAPVIAQNASATNSGQTYWVGEYFNNADLSGSPALVLLDPTLNFAWGTGSPAPGTIQPDHFSARWTRTLALDPGQYQFTATVDDGVRLWVNNQQIVNQWSVHEGQQVITGTIMLPGGAIPVRMEYFADTGPAVARLDWTPVISATQASASQSSPIGNVFTGVVAGTPVLNVRSGPGTQFPQLATLNSGQTIGLIGRNADGSWLQINLPNGGSTGWLSQLYVVPNGVLANLPVGGGIVLIPTPASQAAAPNTGGETTAIVTGTQILNVRSGPGLQFNAVTTLIGGQQVGLEGRDANATWVQIRLANGQLGWVNSSFLTPNAPFTVLPVAQTTLTPSTTAVPTTTVPATSSGQATGTVSGTQILNVRSGPGTQFNQVATLTLGQTIRLTGRTADETWVQVSLANGATGWASSLYVTPSVVFANLLVVQ